MYITNLSEVIPVLRARLRDYLTERLSLPTSTKKFNCFLHDDEHPSMSFNSKNNEQTVRCFTCGITCDIFSACEHLDGLPAKGSEWVNITVPYLAAKLKVPINLGEPSPADREKAKLFRLAQDITDILETKGNHLDYIKERNWSTEQLVIGSIAEDELLARLVEVGWDAADVSASLMVRTINNSFFGEDKVTFAITDHLKRPVGFISRCLNPKSPKYINTPENLIYDKGATLMGLGIALPHAKKHGLYIVEGPGDLAQLHRLGILNAVAICGTAFTGKHLSTLKMLGIRTVYFCLDWDDAGVISTQRVFKEELKLAPGLSCWVVAPPKNSHAKDPDELLRDTTDPHIFTDLTKVGAFEWLLQKISDKQSTDAICAELIPTIATEQTAVRREMLVKTLSQHAGVSFHSIMADVSAIRDSRVEEKKQRIAGAVERYKRDAEADPNNIQALMARHEDDLRLIEKDFQSGIIGINYQLSRYDALQERRSKSDEEHSMNEFRMSHFTLLKQALSNGMSWTEGALIYVPGRANSGKTAVVIFTALDVAMSDPDAIVISHFTDDSYSQVEPRLKTNIAQMLGGDLSIGEAANPFVNAKDERLDLYREADSQLRNLLAEERLIVIDSEDGQTLSTLERHLRYIRQRHPQKKIMVVCDNTHNYQDFSNIENRPVRMTNIANLQKELTAKYRCCMIATAEYRKNMPMDQTKLRLPVDDDIADARALMYRPNMIVHVYNDLNDRKDSAEIFWTDKREPGVPKPRLLLMVTKNKLTKFKSKLVLDLDPDSVTLKQVEKDSAYEEFQNFTEAKEEGTVALQNNQVIYVEADYNEENYEANA